MEKDAWTDGRPPRWLAFGKLRLAVRRSDRRGGGPTLVGRVAVALGPIVDWALRKRGYRSYCLDCRQMVWLLRGKAYSREKAGKHTVMMEWCGGWSKKHRPPEDEAEQRRLGILK